ncbi:hypothetical protein [Mogibacterium timidum]|uniref:hypothetical protein n=1 Tax=Mogibacterium timidum TaxID=35519 RepID=UPI0028DC3E0C|nr:hypothetical protein [Mogibacterium timidum]
MAIMEKTVSLENTYIELVNGKTLTKLDSEILQIETEKQYENGSYGVYICELTERGHQINKGHK